MAASPNQSFTRTVSGLKNYRVFFNVEVIIYTEGRCYSGDPKEDKKAFDSKYYTSLVKSFSSYEKVKVILVGNKLKALEYHQKIAKNNIKNSAVFIDKDYDGIFCSIIPQEKLLTTFGYSWENDFWTEKLCEKTIDSISMKDEDAKLNFKTKSSRCISRLDKISRLNAASHFFHISLMPGSKAKSKGITIECIKKWPISKSEFKRIKSNFIQRITPITSQQYDEFLKNQLSTTAITFTSTIQGHLFEHAMLNILGECYKESVEKKTADHAMIKSIAFTHFDDNVQDCLSESAIAHYKKEFERI